MPDSKDDIIVSEIGIVEDEKDEVQLARMGYKQELRRDLSLLQNFGFSFSIMSVITGMASLFAYGLTTGGPAVMVWGWLIVSFFTLTVGLSMAEICSSHPTSGGPYYWAAMLSPPKYAPIASWLCGWFNLLGQFSGTTGINYACANFISTVSTLGTGYVPSPGRTLGIYAAITVAQGLFNTFGVRFLGYVNNFSVWWHALGTTSIVIAVLIKAPTHQSAKFVFATFIDGTGVDGGVGWSQRASPAYVAVLGILLAQYTLTGYDASAHMSEETHNAAKAGPIGIIMALSVSVTLGWFVILGLLFSIQDYATTVASSTGQPITQVFLDTVGEKGAIALMVIIVVCMFMCGIFAITANSRMMYAFARDGGMPGSAFFHQVDDRWRSPIRTVWLACTLSFLLGLPSLGSSVALSAATSICTIGLYISYGIPIALRLFYSSHFQRGPFHLGPFSLPCAAIAVVWICFITIVLLLPELNPVNSQTLNYAIVAVGVVLVYALGYWVISARRWFRGPVRQVDQVEAESRAVDDTNGTIMVRTEVQKEREASH